MSKLTDGQINLLKDVYGLGTLRADLRIRMQIEFPDVFPYAIKNQVDAIGELCYGYEVFYNDEFVFVRLPNANSEWSFEAFKWVEQFCNYDTVKVHAYPIHGTQALRAINRAVEANLLEHNANYQVINYSVKP